MVGVFASEDDPEAGLAASVAEWRTHFGAWAIVSSPLILSFDLSNRTTLETVWPFITNLEAIEVSQTWAGHPGRQVLQNESVQVWTKQLGPKRAAVLAINMESAAKGQPLQVEIGLTELLPSLTGPIRVRDVWGHRDLAPPATGDGTLTTQPIQPHDSAFLVVEATS